MELDPRIEQSLELMRQSLADNEKRFHEALKQIPKEKRGEYLKKLKEAKEGSINLKDFAEGLKDIS